VKVVRSRAHVDGLQAAVKEKEHIVVHSRFVSKMSHNFAILHVVYDICCNLKCICSCYLNLSEQVI